MLFLDYTKGLVQTCRENVRLRYDKGRCGKAKIAGLLLLHRSISSPFQIISCKEAQNSID